MAGQPLHHREKAVERGVLVVVRLGGRPAVAGKPIHHPEMALGCRGVERGAPLVVSERQALVTLKLMCGVKATCSRSQIWKKIQFRTSTWGWAGWADPKRAPHVEHRFR